ncbi:MAG TPA: hypothetical protein VF281_03095 [Candidatus Saccharimonadales bacterium]
MVRPCISERQAIAEGLNDHEVELYAQQEAYDAFIDEMDKDLRDAFIAEEQEEARQFRQAIINGFDPVRDQTFTLQEHALAIEQLDPPLTRAERLELQLYFATIDDSVTEDWLYQENMAWSLHKGQWGDPQLAE